MIFLMDPEFWARLFGIVIIDLTLAGDNALVIALAVRTLPQRQQFWGRVWGAAGAVGLRLAFIAVATLLLAIPMLQLVGGLLLLWIAFKLVRKETGTEKHVRQGGSLWEAIWIIVLADAIMSLDNVLAVAAAAHGDLFLVTFGIGLSLPIVVWGSSLLAVLMNRFVWIIWVGGGILGYVAGEMTGLVVVGGRPGRGQSGARRRIGRRDVPRRRLHDGQGLAGERIVARFDAALGWRRPDRGRRLVLAPALDVNDLLDFRVPDLEAEGARQGGIGEVEGQIGGQQDQQAARAHTLL